ncbi:hypothetical protein NOJ31_001646 [Salmonella enterica]|nr:hypothetical protein [Salmonella enterica]EEO4123218.1 hypothetical protein [Salmonella enterica]EFU5133647.1 hypothetical protein [Salmonella enterica]EHA6669414.1 hypothetical protein [Salmonella enterica]EJA2161074.1 hypothetical protein [Salmonella enterica]
MHKKSVFCVRVTGGISPPQRGLKGNPERMWLNRRVSVLLCGELARDGVIERSGLRPSAWR